MTVSLSKINPSALRPITRVLVQRLETKGLDSRTIPGYLRSLTNALDKKPHMTLNQVNRQMDYVGWRGVVLDYRTWELTRAALENENAAGAKLSVACW